MEQPFVDSKSRVSSYARGFTVVELTIVVGTIAILAAVTLVVYAGIKERSADVLVRSTLSQAHDTLQLFGSANHNYPSNIANTDFIPPTAVAVTLFTDAAQTPVYSSLSPEENAQLFLNACNGYMPVESGGTTYNTLCTYSGNNLHVKGTVSSNVIISGPTFTASDIILTCGAVCTTVQNNIIATFQAQGGAFPVEVASSGATLPAPTLVSSGQASRYCVQGRSSQFPDIIYHAVSGSQSPIAGACPDDPGLHYP